MLPTPDREHRFGHGKGEAVAGFVQAAFLAGPLARSSSSPSNVTVVSILF